MLHSLFWLCCVLVWSPELGELDSLDSESLRPWLSRPCSQAATLASWSAPGSRGEARDPNSPRNVPVIYWVGQKVRLVFSIRWLWQCLGVFNFIWNNFLRLYCDSCHISVHFKKTSSTLVNFCVAILILKTEENTQHCWHIMLYYFKKGKNTKKDLCSVWRRCHDWSNVSEVVCEGSGWRFLTGWCSVVG